MCSCSSTQNRKVARDTPSKNKQTAPSPQSAGQRLKPMAHVRTILQNPRCFIYIYIYIHTYTYIILYYILMLFRILRRRRNRKHRARTQDGLLVSVVLSCHPNWWGRLHPPQSCLNPASRLQGSKVPKERGFRALGPLGFRVQGSEGLNSNPQAQAWDAAKAAPVAEKTYLFRVPDYGFYMQLRETVGLVGCRHPLVYCTLDPTP